MVLLLKVSTFINGGENSSSIKFEEQLTPEEMDEIEAEIKKLADTVIKHEENFAEIDRKLIALQQQIHIYFGVLVAANMKSTVAYPKSMKIDMEFIREGPTTITGQE